MQQEKFLKLLGWSKSLLHFFCIMVLVVLRCLTSFETISLDYIVTALISAYIFLKTSKIGEFLCSQFNIEDERKYATFLVYYALLFQGR